ncbi:hypothetical protein NPIL_247531 [Nephila pilipes]|uniref:Uncharacterized protein n=1 Tax=Nephila pilipes TaxID=299642 RepID=A0A8X6IL95_NEPPI|nr:hypothetical protein NPIL_247531 [Nephila pilipes]
MDSKTFHQIVVVYMKAKAAVTRRAWVVISHLIPASTIASSINCSVDYRVKRRLVKFPEILSIVHHGEPPSFPYGFRSNFRQDSSIGRQI